MVVSDAISGPPDTSHASFISICSSGPVFDVTISINPFCACVAVTYPTVEIDGRSRVFHVSPSSSLHATYAPGRRGGGLLAYLSATKNNRPEASRRTLGRCPLLGGGNGVLDPTHFFPPSRLTVFGIKPSIFVFFPP